jgi:hypothetical protein
METNGVQNDFLTQRQQDREAYFRTRRGESDSETQEKQSTDAKSSVELSAEKQQKAEASGDFLTQRQQNRDAYFSARRGEGSSAFETKDSVELSAAVRGEVKTQSASGQEGSATYTREDAAGKSDLQKKYGGFYMDSPNGSRLAELRARSDEIMNKTAEREQAQTKVSDPELTGGAEM